MRSLARGLVKQVVFQEKYLYGTGMKKTTRKNCDESRGRKKAENEGRIASHQGTFVTSKGGSSFQQDQGVQLLAQKKQHFLKEESFTLNQDNITFHFNTK